MQVETNVTEPEELNYCAHPGCHCKVQPGEEYCSEECRDRSDDEPCDCGHSGCEAHRGE